MEQIKIEGNLIVRGNLLCEKDGKLEAKGNIHVNCNEYFLKSLGFPNGFYTVGDYDFSGKEVLVTKNVYVYGRIKCDVDVRCWGHEDI